MNVSYSINFFACTLKVAESLRDDNPAHVREGYLLTLLKG